MVSVCLSVCGDKQGRAGARQGGQGRHPPTGPTGGSQQPFGCGQGKVAMAVATGGRARCHFY